MKIILQKIKSTSVAFRLVVVTIIILIISTNNFKFRSTTKVRPEPKTNFSSLLSQNVTERNIIDPEVNLTIRIPLNVLIIAYIRGGSTFTGSILQQIPGVFYAHEPLRFQLRTPFQAEDYFSTSGICSFETGECRRPQAKSFPTGKNILGILKAFYTCKLDRLPRQFMWSKNNISDPRLAFCSHPQSSRCYNTKTQCADSSARVIKSVRLSLDMAEPLFNTIPSLKIMYLIRDPRGLLNSRLNLKIVKTKNVTILLKHVRADCSRIMGDIRRYLQLRERFPDKIKSFLYENLAENPYGVSKQIYDFLQTFPKSTFFEWLHNVTSNGHYDGSFGYVRPVSKNSSFKWRREMDFKLASIIDRIPECAKLYHFIATGPVETEFKMRHVNIPLRHSQRAVALEY